MQSLATKYRPKTLDDVVGQDSIKKILARQIQLKEFKNCYLFNGASGCGKTTCARILADAINNGEGSPIEIDAASNNGVENVRELVKSANERSIDSQYKIYIIDECHSLTAQAWQAFLKCIEEPPRFTIFIFCTTEKNKVPDTIKNRCQVFNFNRISHNEIQKRLVYICREEGFTNFEESCEYISKISNGQVRDAVANLEKCASYNTDLSIENVLSALGDYSYNTYFILLNALLDGNDTQILSIVDLVYSEGADLKQFVEQFLDFCLDVSKYCIFNSVQVIKIPSTMTDELNRCTNFKDSIKYYRYYVSKLLELKNMLKTDINPKSTIDVMFLKMSALE